MIALDGKKRKIQAADVAGILRIIQSIPSPKAEPFKMWLAEVGKEVMQLFRKYNVCEYIMRCYGALHTTGTNYIINDIDLYIQARQGGIKK